MTLLRRHPRLVLALAAVLVVAALAWTAVAVSHAIPPRTLRMTVGPQGQADYELGLRYKEFLERRGVRVELGTSAGKVENIARLKDPKSGYQAGFASGGLTTAGEAPGVVSLGTIAYDPLWIFCRDVPEPVQFSHLPGKRISIGAEGSGTRALALEFLKLNKLDTVVKPLPLSPREGADALQKGEIDCACMLTFAEAPHVRRLLADERVSLMGYPRADAYVALFPFLRKVVLPMGVGDLATNRPPHDVTLIASAESLLVREDLHPAIQYLLLEAAQQIHATAGILQRPGQFPVAEPVDVPLSSEAQQFYKSGGTFLQRHLPFWLWVFASNLLIVLVPLIGVVYPLAQLIPNALKFEMERRLSRLYEELRDIETRIEAPGARPAELEAELDRFESKARGARISKSYASALYTLLHHASLVRERLDRVGG